MTDEIKYKEEQKTRIELRRVALRSASLPLLPLGLHLQ
jgi:hypothetical protein